MRRVKHRLAARLHLGALVRIPSAPFILGLVTGFMPCGALSAAWLAAAGSGSALDGACTMIAFTMGTIPLLQLIGSVYDAVPNRARRILPLAGAVMSVALGLMLMQKAIFALGASFG